MLLNPAASESLDQEQNIFHMMVQSAQEAAPRVMEAAISTAKSIPFRKADAYGLRDVKGKP